MRLGIKVSKSQRPRGLMLLAVIENVPMFFFFPPFFLVNVQKNSQDNTKRKPKLNMLGQLQKA